MKSTIRDVAKEANVSIGTVSRYLNGHKLKQSNMTAIENAIKKLNYQENLIAKGMKNNITKSVGVVINRLTDIFATSIVAKIEEILEQNNYSLILCDYQENEDILNNKLEFLNTRNVDAVILFHVDKLVQGLNLFIEKDIPIICIDCPIKNSQFDTIVIDNKKASYNMTKYLVDHGHKEIAIIGGKTNKYTGKERMNGILECLNDFHIDKDNIKLFYGNYQIDDGYRYTMELLKNKSNVTAIFALNYYMTLGVIQAINELGLSIPNDISVVGFDYLDIFKVLNIDLTMIEQPLTSIGESAALLVLKRMKEKDYHKELIVIPSSIHYGNSVKEIKKI